MSNPNDRQVGGNHYAGEFQHWDFAPRLNLCWQEGCATKYLARIFKKHATDPELVVQDMEKVVHYLEKMIELVEQRIVFPFMNSAPYAQYHVTVYQVWTNAQDFGTTNEDLLKQVRLVLQHLARWSWHPESPVAGIRVVIHEMNNLINLYRIFVSDDPPNIENAFAGLAPTTQQEQEAHAVETKAYQAQSLDPGSQAQPEPAPASTPAVRPEQSLPLEEVLAKYSAMNLQMLLSNQTLSVPMEVYSSLLEELRRYTDPMQLPLNPRLLGDETDHVFTSFRDYAEALNKISVGSRTLEESIPNKQVSRTAIALWAILDGTNNLQHWLLRATEGENPLITDPAEAHAFRLQLQSCTSVLHQKALEYLSKIQVDPGVYTNGSASTQPLVQNQQ